MEIFNDILEHSLEGKIEQFLNHEKNRKKFNDLKDELDNFLKENYGNKEYYDSLYRYIHNGKVSQDTYSNDIMSAFYYTLFRAFLNSDDKFLGENRFSKYHWTKIKKSYPNYKYDKNNIKKCFSYFYNTFKSEFGCPSDINRASVNSIKDTVITTGDCVIDALSNESTSIKETMKEGFAEIRKQSNAERDIQSEKESLLVNKICDYNNEYQERLKDPLFLESDIDDDTKATLADIYIEPHITCDLKKWAENRDSRILLLYGKAGIGKTSYTSWLSLNNIFIQDCHILELRQCIHILDSNNPWESIKKSFRCMSDDEYQNKVLILDGLDEVCVLKSEFDGYEFIENLSNTLRTGFGRSIRIIITSRMGYFNKINIKNHVYVETIFWKEDSVIDWCDKYSQMHSNRAEWCESFKKTYADLETDDKRKDVFCTPLILYICCVSQVDISKHDSVASIYDEAFNVIGRRQYNEWEASKEEFEINRQFTKELAFQMFLNDKLDDVLCSNFVQIAKEKVVVWTQKKYLYPVKEFEFEKLFAINHFAYGKNDAIEFAHKTIGEYFAAVKLYEDYFKHILDGTVENTWNKIFNAFRYKAVPQDIMQYLVDIILNKQDNNWLEIFFKDYYIGIKDPSLPAVVYCKSEYSTSCFALINQFQIAFRNLTWLLTGLGFDNSKFINTKENLEILASYFYGDVNIIGWNNLDNIDLSNSYLESSKFEKVCLKNANFRKANLIRGNFNGAILKQAKFEEADLTAASFMGANLTYADLACTDLTYADLTDAHLMKANLTRADLTVADLTGADLTEANLLEANFRKADLTDADLTDANLTYADLTGVDLINADLTGADFTGADLTDADLTDADFTDANFT